jgi:hypothetical protein
MKMRKLRKEELALVLACLETVRGILESPVAAMSDAMSDELIKGFEKNTGIKPLEFVRKTLTVFEDNPILVMDMEGEEVKGDIKIVEAPLTEYGEPNPFSKLKGMKFPWRKDEPGHELNN